MAEAYNVDAIGNALPKVIEITRPIERLYFAGVGTNDDLTEKINLKLAREEAAAALFKAIHDGLTYSVRVTESFRAPDDAERDVTSRVFVIRIEYVANIDQLL